MKSLLALLFALINLLPVCLSCETQSQLSGTINYTTNVIGSKCWKIVVPDRNYLRLTIEKLTPPLVCGYTKLEIANSKTSYEICARDSNRQPNLEFSDVNITLVTKTRYSTSLILKYNIESTDCLGDNYFRCSNHSCVPQDSVCNGVKNCENGADEEGCDSGIIDIKGVNSSREDSIKKLISKRESFGWGNNTHRAIMALYLTNESYFNNDDLETNLTMKQMQLQTAVIILQNFTDGTSSVSDFSMYIGALAVTCHNPRQFYGYDLLQVLSERLSLESDVIPAAYLTLCNANWALSENEARSLLKILSTYLEESAPPVTKNDALAVMALTCMKKRTKVFDSLTAEEAKTYNDSINKIITQQAANGAFGDLDTTALVTQALMSAAKEVDRSWNLRKTVEYLLKQLNNSADDVIFNSNVLPILNGKCYNDMAEVKCDKFRPQDAEMANILGKVIGPMLVRYSLYVGEEPNSIYTNNFKVPAKSSVYEVMKIAEMADPKYKFLEDAGSGIMHIYEIGGIKNDAESGTYWSIYKKDADKKDILQTESADNIILNDGDHFILWYKILTA